MKIAAGTTSGQKLRYIQEILVTIGLVAEVVPVSAKSNVSDQPLTNEETRLGALNRAKESKCR